MDYKEDKNDYIRGNPARRDKAGKEWRQEDIVWGRFPPNGETISQR